MTKTEEIQIAMSRSVQLCLEQQQDRYEANALLKDEKAKLDTHLEELDGVLSSLRELGTGVAADKQTVRDRLENAVVSVIGILHAHAIRTEDEGLRHLCRTRPSAVARSRDEELMRIATDILAVAEPHAEVLLQADFDQAELDAFRTLKQDFEAKKPAPRVAQSERVSLNKTLGRKLQTILDQIDDVIDRLLFRYETKDPQFYDMYRSARRQVQFGGGKRTPKGDEKAEGEKAPDRSSSGAVVPTPVLASAGANGNGDAHAPAEEKTVASTEVESTAAANLPS